MRAILTISLVLLSGVAHAQQLPGDIPKEFATRDRDVRL